MTGDRSAEARRAAAKLHVSDSRAEALPDEKMGFVLEEIGNGRRPMVVGDGASGPLAAAVLHNAGTIAVMANAGRLLKFQDKPADH